MIKNLDPTKLNAGASPDIFALRNQLQEKTQLIGSLEVGGATFMLMPYVVPASSFCSCCGDATVLFCSSYV